MPGSVFISHAGEDAAVALQVADLLEGGGLDPVIDQTQLGPGDGFLAFMEESLSTSDYCLLLWSKIAAEKSWVQIEWQSALYRAVTEARSFLVAGRLDEHPLPALLGPRIRVDLFPTLRPGIDEFVALWHRDQRVESETGRPVATVTALADLGATSTPIYITSELFGITLPLNVDLQLPAGVLMDLISDRLQLPMSHDYRGRMGVRYEYHLVLGDGRRIGRGEVLADRGVRPSSVLWLEVDMVPFAAASPTEGRIDRVTFRGNRGTTQAQKAARNALTAHVDASRLGKDP